MDSFTSLVSLGRGGRADDTSFDLNRFNANADAAIKACGEDPSKGLLSILKEADAG